MIARLAYAPAYDDVPGNVWQLWLAPAGACPAALKRPAIASDKICNAS